MLLYRSGIILVSLTPPTICDCSTEFQVLTYNDVLYLKLNQKDPVNNKLYNGGVDAVAFITGEYLKYNILFLTLPPTTTLLHP